MEGANKILDEISDKLSDIRDQLKKIDMDVLSVETILADVVTDDNNEEQ